MRPRYVAGKVICCTNLNIVPQVRALGTTFLVGQGRTEVVCDRGKASSVITSSPAEVPKRHDLHPSRFGANRVGKLPGAAKDEAPSLLVSNLG